jgi:hypothetical protein
LKLKCDETLSNFAFNFNVRRHTAARALIDCAPDMDAKAIATKAMTMWGRNKTPSPVHRLKWLVC